MIAAGGCVTHDLNTCEGWELRDPKYLDSQSHWMIFRCRVNNNVWHVNGPARTRNGTVIFMNVDYRCGAEALEAFNNGWSENARYTKRLVQQQ